MASRKRSISYDADMHDLCKEWDEASCPICMDHPHNAVLLLCSSHDKGCRSYICDTSYRHSNCLDRFRKLTEERNSQTPPRNQHDVGHSTGLDADLRISNIPAEARGPDNLTANSTVVRAGTSLGFQEGSTQDIDVNFGLEGNQETQDSDSSLERADVEDTKNSNSMLRCPLCRGNVLGWKVVEEARKYLNLKSRSCSRESCSFSGSYRELREHARRVHPTARPADIDPSRQRAWRRLQDQREHDDIVSAIRSAMPGAIVFGDYVIENGDRGSGERERFHADGRLLSTLVFFQMIDSMVPGGDLRGARSRPFSRYRRSSGRRHLLWGENLVGIHDHNDENDDNEDREPELNILSDTDDDVSSNPRRRRRLTRSRSDEDQS